MLLQVQIESVNSSRSAGSFSVFSNHKVIRLKMLRKKLTNVANPSAESNKKQKTAQPSDIQLASAQVLPVTSKHFTDSNSPATAESNQKPIWEQLYEIECKLNAAIETLRFNAPVAAVYNPIDYAADLHCAYLQTYLHTPLTVLFVGMNPGPWGMCQTGVIFFTIIFASKIVVCELLTLTRETEREKLL